MRIFKQLLDFYIDCSIHVAVGVFSLVQITKLELNIFFNSNLDFFIFFGTIVGYNFLKYFEVFSNKIFTFKKNYSIVLVSLVAVLGVFFYFIQLERKSQIAFLGIGALVAIYPFVRQFSLFKMAYVSFCLILITVYVFLDFKSNWIYLFQRLLVIFCLLIPLEIYDFKIDSKTITTLPKIIGIQNLKYLGYLLLTISCFLNLRFEIAIIIGVAIFFTNENQSKYYTNFWVESIPVLWYILLLFTK